MLILKPLDHQFHLIISTATRNNAILYTIKNFWHLRDNRENIKEAYGAVCSTESQKRIEEHRAIF